MKKMKMKTTLAIVALMICTSAFAQQDSVKVKRDKDTIEIGGIIILKKGNEDENRRVVVTVGRPKQMRTSNVSTHSFFFDLGFSNWNDNTDYAAATASNTLVNRPATSALAAKDFKLRTGKSINFNVWIIGQRVNLVKHQLNLKYAFGLELNNYRFRNNISFNEGGLNPYNSSQDISHAFVFRDSIDFSKNKLAADYLTIPVMLNFRTNPYYSNKGLSLSAGVSMGYLYSSRNKQKSDERGKKKNRGDYDLEKWKFSYVGELGIGFVHLYGSYSPNSIFKNDLNFQPYTIGLRFSSW